MHDRLFGLALLATTAALIGEAVPARQPDVVRRLAPDAFPRLPVAIRQALNARGCRIPQTWDARSPVNVAHGDLTAAGSGEWAILCSTDGASQILVYRVGPASDARVVDSLSSSSDATWIQDVGGGRRGYSRLIRVKPQRQIRAWREDRDRHSIPQPIDHDAIEQVYLEKGADAFYLARGRWYRRTTAD